ncbi:MAG: aspartate carbamoyltransferase catalytic subunit [Fimbriimonadaceae bacterium]|jgi:aspartate carbamoyltransferase catalytic subunit|nr:aspartate carbamoyltransferase catalytic subunit [Fimbriimonadaceae bacterium]
MNGKNVLAIRTLDKGVIQQLVDIAGDLKREVLTNGWAPRARRRTIGLLFFENSTRTRVSFEQAANYLGYTTVNFSGSGSSLSKGETLKDTILTLKHERLEALVIRHSSSGAANLAAEYFGGPVINAGDGLHEHPTQALGDALTILERKGTLTGLKIAIVGDVNHSRVARSNAWLLSKLGNEVRFIGPRTLVPTHSSFLPASTHLDLRSGLAGADVVMCLRLQRERMEDGMLSSVGEYTRLYQVNRTTIRAAASEAIVMHPGPLNRGVEIDDFTADGPQSAILDQVTNGIFVRMAAMQWIFESDQVEVLA